MRAFRIILELLYDASNTGPALTTVVSSETLGTGDALALAHALAGVDPVAIALGDALRRSSLMASSPERSTVARYMMWRE